MLLVEGVRSSLMKSELEGISSEWCRNWVDIDTQRTKRRIFIFIVNIPPRCPKFVTTVVLPGRLMRWLNLVIL
jgi:hypothetical protein